MPHSRKTSPERMRPARKKHAAFADSAGQIVRDALRNGVPFAAVADLLIRVYGFDAATAQKIAASFRPEK